MANQQTAGATWRRRVARVAVVAGSLLLGATASAQNASMTLEWDPSPTPEVVGYRVYVGHESGVYFTSFDIPNQMRFVFSDAQLGVLYHFAVAARGENGAISALSNEVSGVAQTEAGPILEPPDSIERQDTSFDRRSASTGARCGTSRCAGATVVMRGAGSIGAMTLTADGRLIYVENDRRIQIAHLRGEKPATALEVAHPGVSVHGVALDPDFARTGFVFVSLSTTGPDGRRDLRILRLRELGGTLGEGATLISGLPDSPTVAPFVVDGEGNLVLAIPAATDGRSDPYAGQVLAFTQEGRTRPGDGPGAPVIAPAGPRPTGLFWDEATGQLWMASLDRQSLVRIDLPAGARPTVGTTTPLPFRPTAAAFRRNGDVLAVVLTSDAGRLYRGAIDNAGRLTSLDEITVPEAGTPGAVAIGTRQDIYVSMRVGDDWTILRVER